MNNLRYVLVHKSILWNSIRVAMAYVFWGLVTTQALGQTNPTPQALPYSQNFGTTTFTSMPAGMAAWSGVNGSDDSTLSLAESSVPSGNATVHAATTSTTSGGVYGYAAASSNNASAYIQTSNNRTNGVDQIALSINTNILQNIVLAYDISIINAQPRTIGLVAQYRVGHTGTWTTITGTDNPYSQAGGTTGFKTRTTLTLPSGANNQPEVQIRWAVWRGNQSGASSGIAIDSLSVTGSPGLPAIALSSPAASNSNISEGVTNQPIFRVDLAVSTASATLSGLSFVSSGSYLASDLSNLKCWYSSDTLLDAGTDALLSTKTLLLGQGTHQFPSFVSQLIQSGNTGYIYITADIPLGSTIGNTLIMGALDTSNLIFTSGAKTGQTSASGTKTIVACIPTNASGLGLTVGTSQLTIAWTNPACVDEVLMVVKPTSSVGASPSGDGSAYTANLIFGTGSSFDGTGSVVYKGISSPQIITGLTNGATYYVKVFTRRGSVWSAGLESSPTTILTGASKISFIGSSGGAWLTAGNWSPATVPNSSQVATFSGSQTSVGIKMNTNHGESVGAIEMESGKTGDILFGNSSNSGDTLTFTGVVVNGVEQVVLRNNDDNLLTLRNPLSTGSTFMDLAFVNPINNKIIVDGSGGVDILSAIVSNSGPVTVGGLGSGTVTYSGPNTYTSLTTVEGASLRLNHTGGNTLPVTNNISLSNGSLKISTNQSLNNLNIIGGTLLVDAGVTLTINGTLTLSGGTITNNGTITYGTSGALVYGASSRTVGAEWPSSNGPLNVTIGSGGVTLGVARMISATGKLTLNGVFATGGNLTLASDSNGTAVVLGGTNSDLTGNVTVQRYLPRVDTAHNGFRFVGHPLRSNPSLNSVTNLPTSTNTVIVYQNDSNNYLGVNNRATIWPQAIGYGVWTDVINTLIFNGELQLSSVPALSLGTATDRWNYVSNPFPSVLDWEGVTRTNVEGTIYRWDKSKVTFSAGGNQAAGTWGTYVISTGVTANGGSRYMAPMQGFMVQASSGASSASLAYPSSARVDQPANYVRQQQTADVARASVTHTASGFGLETVLCFVPQASNAYDNDLEARYLSDGFAASQDLYTKDAQGQTYSIQSLPLLALDSTTRIPLHLAHTQPSATYSWNMDLSALSSGHASWLEDTRLGTLTPVVSGQPLTFTAQAGDAVDRFHWVFAAQGTAVQDLVSVEKVTALVSDGRLNLRGLHQGPITLQWMDLSGRLLCTQTLSDPNESLECPSNLLEGSFYLLRVQSPQGLYHNRLRR